MKKKKKNQIEDDINIHIEYKINNSFEENEEPLSYIQEIEADIYGDYQTKEKIGKISLYLLDMSGEFNEGFNYEDMLDGYSMELANYVNDFFNLDENIIKPQFYINDFSYNNPDILIIHTVVLNANERNKGYGLRVIKNIELVFGKNKLIILRPFPVQFGGMINDNLDDVKEFNLDLLPKNEDMCDIFIKKIAKNYEKIGYKKDGESDLMFKPNHIQ